MTDRRREQGCIAVAIRWPLSTPCLKMTTLRFSESHSEVFEADGANLTTQIPRQIYRWTTPPDLFYYILYLNWITYLI